MKISKALRQIVLKNIKQWQKDADKSFIIRQKLARKLDKY